MISDFSSDKSLAPMSDCIPKPKIQLHISINVVSHLFMVERGRSLSVEEHSL
jgi:hypothetical protein